MADGDGELSTPRIRNQSEGPRTCNASFVFGSRQMPSVSTFPYMCVDWFVRS